MKSSVTLWLVPNEPIVSCYSYSNNWQDVSPGRENDDDDESLMMMLMMVMMLVIMIIKKQEV